MKKNDRFQFVIYRENYLSDIECDKLIQALDTEELKEGELVGDYTDGIINKNVRQTLNIDFRDENLFVKLNNAIKLANEQYFNYEGGDFEFGLTDKEGNGLIKGNRTKGCLIVFPSFLSHRVTPITKGKRYSIITWMEGDTFR